MNPHHVADVENFICNFPQDGIIPDENLKKAIGKEIDQYRLVMKRNRDTRRIQCVINRELSPADYWELDGEKSFPHIAKVALSVFAMVSSTASVERSFKTCGNILTKQRNRLGADKAAKLATISMNYKLLQINQGEDMHRLPVDDKVGEDEKVGEDDDNEIIDLITVIVMIPV